jgi:hypothetical protein
MRNPDPREGPPEQPGEPDGRRGALVGLIVVLLLIAGALALTRVLRGMSQLQDCSLSGRSNCG